MSAETIGSAAADAVAAPLDLLLIDAALGMLNRPGNDSGGRGSSASRLTASQGERHRGDRRGGSPPELGAGERATAAAPQLDDDTAAEYSNDARQQQA